MKLKELEKRLRQEPDNLGLRVQVAGLMREAGRSLESVELYRSVALAYRDQGRTQQAIAVCRSILEIAPEDAACQGLLAMLQGRSSGAPSRPPPTSQPPEPPPQVVPATPVKITEPVSIPSVPMLRATTKNQPAVSGNADDDDRIKPAVSVEPHDPGRRSSLDETPLPRPIPYHLSDPTSQPHKISARDLEESAAKPITSRTGGLAEAARRISGLISNKESHPGIPNKEMDMSAELDTRQRPKVRTEQLRKLTPFDPPSDVRDPHEHGHGHANDEQTAPRSMPLEDPTRNPALDGDHDDRNDPATERHHALTPPPRGSEDHISRGSERIPPPPMDLPRPDSDQRITPRPMDLPRPDSDQRITPPNDYGARSDEDFYTPAPGTLDDALTPPPLSGTMPPLEPPRSSALPSRPPKAISIPPFSTSGTTKSQPPLGTEPPIRRAPPLPRIPKSRDSDDELTVPRERLPLDDDDEQ